MTDLLTKSLGLTLAAFIFVSMFNLGLDLTIRQIVEPLRDRWMLTRSVVVNALVVPLMALALGKAFEMEAGILAGFLLYACCIGSEAAPKFAQIMGGNAALAVALLGVFLSITVISVPMLLTLLLPGAHIDQGKLVLKLLMIVALPLGLGLAIRAARAALALRMSPRVHRFSSVLLLLVFLQIIYVHFDTLKQLQITTLLAALLFFASAFCIGLVSGGREPANRRALAMLTGIRGGSLAMVIAGQAFPTMPEVLMTATVMTVMSVIIFVPGSYMVRSALPLKAVAA